MHTENAEQNICRWLAFVSLCEREREREKKKWFFPLASILHRMKKKPTANIVEKIKFHSNVWSMESVVFFPLFFIHFTSFLFLSLCIVCVRVCFVSIFRPLLYVTLLQPFSLHTIQFLSDFRESNSALQLLANVQCIVQCIQCTFSFFTQTEKKTKREKKHIEAIVVLFQSLSFPWNFK